MRLKGGYVFDPGRGFVKEDLSFNHGKISNQLLGEEELDIEDCYVLPGLIDIHFHGCVGEDFSDGTVSGLEKIAAYELRRGVTGICPAGMTLAEDTLKGVCEAAGEFKKKDCKDKAELLGINLEGPFLSMAKKGAQNADFLHKPDIEMLKRLQKAADGNVKLVTLAAEEEGAMDFIREAVKMGIRVSLGHTTAGYDIANRAYKAGATGATHLFNAMPPFAHRDPGVVGAAFDNRDVTVELIGDGVHIHPAVVRSVFSMFGRDRVVLISDSLRACGLGDGEYPFGGQEIEVHGSRATMKGHPETLAGSVSDLMAVVKKVVSFGIPLRDAVIAASVNPARAIGAYDHVGSLDEGKDANIVVLDKNLTIKLVFYRGNMVK